MENLLTDQIFPVVGYQSVKKTYKSNKINKVNSKIWYIPDNYMTTQ